MSRLVRRQVPRPKELLEFIRLKKPALDQQAARVAAAQSIDDLRRLARRRAPKAVFDYTDGSADREISLNRARRAFEDVEFHPQILTDVSKLDTTTTVLGGESALPFGIAPTGFTRLMHTEGEYAGATAAQAAGIPFCLSTLGTASPEEVAATAPAVRRWFQLYVMKEREVSYALAERAYKAGFDTLLFTVDTPVAGNRTRDARNGFSIPPQLTMRTVVDAALRPRWWMDLVTTPQLQFASLTSTGGTVGELLDKAMDPTIDLDDLEEIRGRWPGKIVVKGVQTLEDAKRLADLGVDGIWLSNHGGRQLDQAPVPFHLLPSVAEAVGDEAEIFVDTGIMHGSDIVASLALGADFAFVGRAYLYGLMAGGQKGVERAIEILAGEVRRTMRLLQVSSVDELTPEHVTQLRSLRPVDRPGELSS
ncbi:alpha-hydroxy acid oxidase [Corynebacterium otitidis]|uniref:L-lactate dehydrogenase (Cytochrome) n=1 Tax=Corynebacterium otitidis ATCC 51513 TaxID=883169 RepID=I7L876_9CORY|nr:alpha-hydroxy acid oxidase [Corynebacterium otitidis]EJZ82865.1 hypothetical protein HMPREF9719_00188 [Corynebacterium otitidis ATCC 51513]CCI83072.1 L-lactate dehydrogenase (cytochrome) [Corynebacterium otitidis ATCC 51513]